MEMDFILGFEYIVTAMENFQEDKVYQRWINGYQHIEYSEFKKKMGHVKESQDNRSEETILESVRNILSKKIDKRGDDVNGNI